MNTEVIVQPDTMATTDYKSVANGVDLIPDRFASRESLLGKDENDGSFTMQEAIDHIGFGRFQLKMSILAGLIYMCDAMEIMLLSLLAPILQCTWKLTGVEEALLAGGTFLGMFISGNLWGMLCDKFGRKTTLLLMATWSGYFGVLCSISPTFTWLVVLRMIVGFGLGATPQSMTYYSEFLPTKSRSVCIFLITIIWAVGSCLQVIIAMFVMPTLGWRWLIVISSTPLFLFVGLYKQLPESPRYCLVHGQYEKAIRQLEVIAKENGSTMPPGILYDPCSQQEMDKNKLSDLFHPTYRWITILVCLIWFAANTSYFGTVILTTALFENKDGCHGYDVSESSDGKHYKCLVHCVTLSTSDYIDLLITSIGDVPGLFVAIFMFHKFGRKKGMGFMLFAYTVVMLVCNFCAPRIVLVLILFTARALGNAIGQGGYVYVAEVFPTSIRAIALGTTSTVGRTSTIIAPFISQSLIKISAHIPITLFAFIGFFGGICCLLLPVETKGRSMVDTMGEQPVKVGRKASRSRR